jgi:hypothetical protein
VRIAVIVAAGLGWREGAGHWNYPVSFISGARIAKPLTFFLKMQ